MTRVLLIGDVHLSDNPPSSRTPAYAEDVLRKLEWAVEYAVDPLKGACDAIVQAGDLFHVKQPHRTSHGLVQATINVLRLNGSHEVPVYVVPGNHDLSHDRLDSLGRQPLGTLEKAQGIELLIGSDDTYGIYGIPWLQDWEKELVGWLRNYQEWADGHRSQNDGFTPLLVTHAPLFPPGQQPPYEYISAQDWASLMWNGDCYYGHIHDPHGSYQVDGHPTVTFCNNGALSRGSLHEETLKRQPAVTVWDSSGPLGQRFERVELPYGSGEVVKPVEEVFSLEVIKARDESNAGHGAAGRPVEEFLSQLSDGMGKVVLSYLTVEEVLKHVEALELSPRTLNELRSCVEHAQAQIPKGGST